MPLSYGKGNFELQFTSLSVCFILRSKDTGIFHSEMSITVKIYDSTRVLYEHITSCLSLNLFRTFNSCPHHIQQFFFTVVRDMNRNDIRLCFLNEYCNRSYGLHRSICHEFPHFKYRLVFGL